jgi:PIN domain nuclease of toxin-antitoxin system
VLNYLLDTHILIWRLTDFRRLSRDQNRVLDRLEERNESFAISGITLLEMAVLQGSKPKRDAGGVQPLLSALASTPFCQILPITTDIALEVNALGDALRDPGDRTIVATARVHNLRLITSDHRIISSGLVPVIA